MTYPLQTNGHPDYSNGLEFKTRRVGPGDRVRKLLNDHQRTNPRAVRFDLAKTLTDVQKRAQEKAADTKNLKEALCAIKTANADVDVYLYKNARFHTANIEDAIDSREIRQKKYTDAKTVCANDPTNIQLIIAEKEALLGLRRAEFEEIKTIGQDINIEEYDMKKAKAELEMTIVHQKIMELQKNTNPDNQQLPPNIQVPATVNLFSIDPSDCKLFQGTQFSDNPALDVTITINQSEESFCKQLAYKLALLTYNIYETHTYEDIYHSLITNQSIGCQDETKRESMNNNNNFIIGLYATGENTYILLVFAPDTIRNSLYGTLAEKRILLPHNEQFGRLLPILQKLFPDTNFALESGGPTAQTTGGNTSSLWKFGAAAAATTALVGTGALIYNTATSAARVTRPNEVIS